MLFLLSLLCSFLFLFFLNFRYKQTNAYKNQFIDVCKFYNNSSEIQDAQIINLGSNHPKFGFLYEGLGIKGTNCAVGPQTLEYDFAILRHVTPLLSKGAVVVIPLCLLNFFLHRQEQRFIHTKYYTFLPSKDIVNYSMMHKLRYLDYPLLFNPKLLRYIIKDVPEDKRLMLDSNPLVSDAALNKDADGWIRCWNKEFDIQLPNPKLSEKNKEDIEKNITILRDMLQYCQAHGLKPVITVLPVTDYLHSRFTDDFVNNHIIRYIEEANAINAPFLNYLNDHRFTSSNYYINSFFMNKKGRTYFTQCFIDDLKKSNLL